MTVDFTASQQALGYFYQTYYALWLLMRVGRDEPEAALAIERLDDITVENTDGLTELVQTKHHIAPASLTDASSDLWKTLRIWSTAVGNGTIDPSKTALTLVTTGLTPEGSVARKLRPREISERDVDSALAGLLDVIETSKSKENKAAYDAFRTLTIDQQRALVNGIRVIDDAPAIVSVRDKITGEIRIATRPQFLAALTERLEGWWNSKVVAHLYDQSSCSITYIELLGKINEIQDQFHHDNLPIDFPDPLDLDEAALQKDERIFVEQLNLIRVTNNRVRKAISDYYRASKQRSLWVRQLLLSKEDLEKYQVNLIDQWERKFEIAQEECELNSSEEIFQRTGKALFNWIDEQNFPIRPRCLEHYITRGSYHILSNRLRVGWHLDYRQRLAHLIRKLSEGGQ